MNYILYILLFLLSIPVLSYGIKLNKKRGRIFLTQVAEHYSRPLEIVTADFLTQMKEAGLSVLNMQYACTFSNEVVTLNEGEKDTKIFFLNGSQAFSNHGFCLMVVLFTFSDLKLPQISIRAQQKPIFLFGTTEPQLTHSPKFVKEYAFVIAPNNIEKLISPKAAELLLSIDQFSLDASQNRLAIMRSIHYLNEDNFEDFISKSIQIAEEISNSEYFSKKEPV